MNQPKALEIQQVTIFQKSGKCILNLDNLNSGIGEDLFSGLLSALDSFSLECLGLELCELVTNKFRVFLSRAGELILAVVTEGTDQLYVEFRPKILSLIEKIWRTIHTVEYLPSDSEIKEDTEIYTWLRENIESKIAQTFPETSWCGIPIKEELLLDITGIRILTHLADQVSHTRYELNKTLSLSRSLIEEKLGLLAEESLIIIEEIASGSRKIKKYYISEIGKLIVEHLEIKFPGLWFQSITS